MKFIQGVPEVTVSVSDEKAWVIYEDGYIEFGVFGNDDTCAERLSHWVRRGEETYPRTEEEVANVLARVLAAIASNEW